MISRRAFNSTAITSSALGTGMGFSQTVAASTSKPEEVGGADGYATQHVSFQSQNETLVGKLFAPTSGGPHPAVAIVGPVAFVKEQSPMQYATWLAARELAALTFDPRTHGESSGAPRRHESGNAKIGDLAAALSFLEAHENVIPDKLNLLGICQGVNWAIEAAIKDRRVQSLGIVAVHFSIQITCSLTKS